MRIWIWTARILDVLLGTTSEHTYPSNLHIYISQKAIHDQGWIRIILSWLIYTHYTETLNKI